MTIDQRLQERYEDALFAVMMYEFAENESLLLLKELCSCSDRVDFGTNVSLDRRTKQTIEKELKKQKRTMKRRIPAKGMRTLAAVIALLAVLFTTAFAAFEEFRVATMNLIITVEEEFTRIGLAEDTSSTVLIDASGREKYFDEIDVTWIPPGYERVACDYNYGVDFMDETGSYFTISKFDGDFTYNVDTENADEIRDVEIHGCKGVVILKDGSAHYALAHLENGYFIDVAGSGVPEEYITKIVENLVIQE